jgi:hypothetical protein
MWREPPSGGAMAQVATSDGIIASSSIGISVACLLALILVVAFLLKRKASHRWDEGHEMDDERDKSNGDDEIDVQECEAMTINDVCDVPSAMWLGESSLPEEEAFLVGQ